MTRAMLLSAGMSTRLGALGDQRPKPLLPVCDIPILRYGIANLAAHSITDLVINLHHRGGLIERELGDGSELGVSIQYIEEPTILGTGGGLKNALALLDPDGVDEPFISLNGKLIFDLDLGALVDAYAGRPDALGMMVVRPVADALDWGAVAVDTSGPPRVTDILGEGGHMFCGVHITRPSVMARLPDGEACSIRQGYLPWLRDGAEVAAFEVDPARYFCEHSTPDRYLDGNLALLGGAALANPPGRLRGVAPTAHIHSTATIRHPVKIGDGAHIGADSIVGPSAVVGEHAIVEAGASLVESVVWPRARVRGQHRRAIITPRAAVDASRPPG
jgi:NDP-sugar pyrophosphorylase family protein